MSRPTQRVDFPGAFFLLAFLLAAPFWVLSAVTGSTLPVAGLPISALIAVCPAIAASIVVGREEGAEGVKRLWARVADAGNIPRRWFLPIFLLMPAILTIEYGIMWLRGTLPANPSVPLWLVIPYFVLFFPFAVGEELGWTGYATAPLQRRWPALTASLVLGAIWAIWHSVSFAQTHHSSAWVLWQSATTIGLRVLIVWIYNNTGGSVFAAIAFHDMVNVSDFLYPNGGSGYDPFLTSIVMAAVIVVIVVLWGPRTLARFHVADAGRAG